MDEQQTATRATLDEAWQDAQRRLDWMSAPNAANWINKLVSGADLPDGHWARYANKRHVEPLLAKRRAHDPAVRGLSMASLGCGSGHIEEALISQCGWPIASLTGLEYDSALRDAAARRFAALPDVDSEFYFFDFNSSPPPHRTFDIVFSCHAIHHASDLEKLLFDINSMLTDDGLFIGIDFFGPTRFQVEHDVRRIIEEIYALLSDNFKYDLREPAPVPPAAFRFPSIAEVRSADISESVRSSDLRTLLFSNFPVIEMKPMGGTILRWLLQYRAGNFDPKDPSHVTISNLLFYIEKLLIESRTIRSDDLFFVLGKSNSLSEVAQG